jgi:thiol-disulfide isomerase/thioredoxin
MTERREPQDDERRAQPRTLRLIVIAALLGAAAGLVAVYGIGGLTRNDGAEHAACRGAVEAAGRLAPLARGDMAAFTAASAARRLPPLSFRDGSGKALSLADFGGKTVLLNLWATWCVPCRKEMPTLDELQRTLGGADFQVVAINVDSRDLAKARRFYDEIKLRDLPFYEDQSLGVFEALKKAGKVVGLPTTILIDRQGCELGLLAGPAEWASADALALLRAAIGR